MVRRTKRDKVSRLIAITYNFNRISANMVRRTWISKKARLSPESGLFYW